MNSNSIRAIGLQKYLDDPVIVEKHQGRGYKAFLKDLKDRRLTLETISKRFSVSRMTIGKWLTILETEKRK